VARGIAALQELKTRYTLSAKAVRAVGTAVLRMAQNPEAFTGPAEQILGTQIEIITGEQEAQLVSQGAVLGLGRLGPWVIADVGGQSIEISWPEAGARRSVSLPVGVVALTRAFFKSDPPGSSEIQSLKAHIRAEIAKAAPNRVEGDLLAVAGTATTLGALDLSLDSWQPEQLHGLVVTRDRLDHWLAQMLEVDSAQRTERYGIRPNRADVFPAGLSALAEIMDRLDRTEVTVSVHGLRVGAALEMLKGTENGAWTGR